MNKNMVITILSVLLVASGLLNWRTLALNQEILSLNGALIVQKKLCEGMLENYREAWTEARSSGEAILQSEGTVYYIHPRDSGPAMEIVSGGSGQAVYVDHYFIDNFWFSPFDSTRFRVRLTEYRSDSTQAFDTVIANPNP